MKTYGRTALSEFLGDFVVYRNLVPVDEQLPPLEEIRPRAGIPEGTIPRKSEPDYARVLVHVLRQARALGAPGSSIERLIYVGDTQMNDGTAFVNICRAGGWPGLAFIGADRKAAPHVEILEREGRTLYVSNRWAMLPEFDRFCSERRFPVDERTAVIVDMDKTALGARGRNDHVIDRARVEAVRRTVGELLGEGFDAESFQTAYDYLNQPEFHPFTADNQDYLAYTCLILGSGLYALDTLVAEVRAQQISTFAQFLEQVDRRKKDLPVGLRPIHSDIVGRVRDGDPTPFKAFRYNEYRTTVERLGQVLGDRPATELLDIEIVVTQEVREVALAWREQGALLFGLSDKPDEASVPTGPLAAEGYPSIHRAETHAVGA
jgi:hypothetical protein